MNAQEAYAIHRRIELATENARKLGFKLKWIYEGKWYLGYQMNPKWEKTGTTIEELEWFLDGMIFHKELLQRQKEKWL